MFKGLIKVQIWDKYFTFLRYEGEFVHGWFHGYGVFWRADGMRHEGEFRGGKIWGRGKKICLWKQYYKLNSVKNFILYL